MPWYDVLLAVRRVASREGPITAAGVGVELEMPPRIASMWLAKLWRWGYLRRREKVLEGRRWTYRYELTRWGERFRPRKRKRRK